MKKILAVIPARGNSKSIKKKNIVKINNKPLIYFTIKEAQKSKLITDLILSSESEEIKKIANKYGCSTPFSRPKNLSRDSTKTFPVIKHALRFMENKKKIKYDLILLLQPTSPLREGSDIDDTIKILSKNYNKYDSLVSIVDVGAWHPYRMKTIKNKYLRNFYEQGFEDMRARQKLPKVYIRNGSIYLIKREKFLQLKSLVGKSVYPYIMDEKRSINIDNYNDLAICKKYMNDC